MRSCCAQNIAVAIIASGLWMAWSVDARAQIVPRDAPETQFLSAANDVAEPRPGAAPKPKSPASPDRKAQPPKPPAQVPAAPAQEPRPEWLVPLDQMPASAPESPIFRLASVPNMFGDTLTPMFKVFDPNGFSSGLPLAGGAGRTKIAENNKPLPMDRVYVTYQHFSDAIPTVLPGQAPSALPLDRCLVGWEKTFFDGRWSVDLRMPFAGQFGINDPSFIVDAGQVGNLAVEVKRLLAVSDTFSLVIGLGIDTPTGSDVSGRDPLSSPSTWTLHNDAVYVSPFVGLLAAPNDRWFTQGFVQVDVPCYGNRLTCVDPLGTITDFGLLSDQTLLFVDICAGYWLHRDEAAPWITGLAALVEIHYTGTLQDADSRVATLDGNAFLFTNPHNRLDMANLTTGVHCQLGQRTALRAAGVFPLTNDANRLFDAEFQFAVDRRF